MNNSDSTDKKDAKYVFVRAALSMLLLWISFPPVGVPVLAWFALLPLVHLIASDETLQRRHYWKLWLAGLFYWLATFYFIPIPHPALWLGWIVVSLYLACYLPVFVMSCRTMKHKFKVPYLLAIPICWVGLELVRSYLFTGMALVCLSHSQYQFPVVIQVGDLFGAYTLSFAIVFVATGISRLVFLRQKKMNIALTNMVFALGMFGLVVAYGNYRINQQEAGEQKTLQIGMIQGSIDTIFPSTEEEARELYDRKTAQYEKLTVDALSQWEHIDLLIWPENGWPVRDLHPDTDKTKMHREEIDIYDDNEFYAWSRLFAAGKPIPPILAGSVTVDPVKKEIYGSAICFDQNGEVIGRYYKNHLVMFGEYVPLANWFPLLQRIPAIGKGLNAGFESITIDINGVAVAPSICFETTIPHYIRKQVNQLADKQQEPDVLVNVTNDGWFYGTSCLDFHLACNVFRAVEMRKPHLVCANTGLSASIDHKGRILEQGPRRKTKAILTKVTTTNMSSPYRVIGDWIPISFACLTLICALTGMFSGRSHPIGV